jgi:hypothetical protein
MQKLMREEEQLGRAGQRRVRQGEQVERADKRLLVKRSRREEKTKYWCDAGSGRKIDQKRKREEGQRGRTDQEMIKKGEWVRRTVILKREEEKKGTNTHREKSWKEQKIKSYWREKRCLLEEVACRPMKKRGEDKDWPEEEGLSRMLSPEMRVMRG